MTFYCLILLSRQWEETTHTTCPKYCGEPAELCPVSTSPRLAPSFWRSLWRCLVLPKVGSWSESCDLGLPFGRNWSQTKCDQKWLYLVAIGRPLRIGKLPRNLPSIFNPARDAQWRITSHSKEHIHNIGPVGSLSTAMLVEYRGLF